jgi:hypothetical protein
MARPAVRSRVQAQAPEPLRQRPAVAQVAKRAAAMAQVPPGPEVRSPVRPPPQPSEEQQRQAVQQAGPLSAPAQRAQAWVAALALAGAGTWAFPLAARRRRPGRVWRQRPARVPTPLLSSQPQAPVRRSATSSTRPCCSQPATRTARRHRPHRARPGRRACQRRRWMKRVASSIRSWAWWPISHSQVQFLRSLPKDGLGVTRIGRLGRSA